MKVEDFVTSKQGKYQECIEFTESYKFGKIRKIKENKNEEVKERKK